MFYQEKLGLKRLRVITQWMGYEVFRQEIVGDFDSNKKMVLDKAYDVEIFLKDGRKFHLEVSSSPEELFK